MPTPGKKICNKKFEMSGQRSAMMMAASFEAD